MPKLNLVELARNPEVDRILDPFAFEHYCGTCDNFYDPVNGYSEYMFKVCPREGKVDYDTDWTVFNCKNYWN